MSGRISDLENNAFQEGTTTVASQAQPLNRIQNTYFGPYRKIIWALCFGCSSI